MQLYLHITMQCCYNTCQKPILFFNKDIYPKINKMTCARGLATHRPLTHYLPTHPSSTLQSPRAEYWIFTVYQNIFKTRRRITIPFTSVRYALKPIVFPPGGKRRESFCRHVAQTPRIHSWISNRSASTSATFVLLWRSKQFAFTAIFPNIFNRPLIDRSTVSKGSFRKDSNTV